MEGHCLSQSQVRVLRNISRRIFDFFHIPAKVFRNESRSFSQLFTLHKRVLRYTTPPFQEVSKTFKSFSRFPIGAGVFSSQCCFLLKFLIILFGVFHMGNFLGPHIAVPTLRPHIVMEVNKEKSPHCMGANANLT